MSRYFFDSSALVKRYMPETGTAWVRKITSSSSGNVIFLSQITPVETVSAITRRMHAQTISARTARAARVLIERHYVRQYSEVLFTDAIRISAEDMLEKYQLRAADAIQLATALDVFAATRHLRTPPMIFVCADQRLLSAASAEGLPTDDPNLHL